MTTQRTIFLTIFIFLFIIPSLCSFASSLNVIALGKNINSRQKKEILNFFNPPSSNYSLLNITEKNLPVYENLLANTTKNKHLSCIYIQLTKKSNVDVKTTNLTYVTSWLLSDALIISGIDNLNAIVAAPTQISGLHSFPSIIFAYENCTGKKISSEKIKLSSDLIDTILKISYTENISQTRLSMVFANIENNIINGSNISNTVKSTFESSNLFISTEETNDIIDLMTQIQKQSYNKSSMESALTNFNLRIKCKLQRDGQLYGFFNNIGIFIYRIKCRLISYFSSSNHSTSILNNINENSMLAKTAVRTGDSKLVHILN